MMMEKVRALGLDIGTSTLCAAVMDGKTGELLDTFTKPNHAVISSKNAWESIVYLDDEGHAVSALHTWQDGRGNLAYREGFSYADHLSKATGYRLATGFGAVTHFYNLVNGLVPGAATSFCTIHDYAAMKLAGLRKPLIHPTNAASLGCYKSETNDFDRQAVNVPGMDGAFFPEVSPEIRIIGTTGSNVPVAIAIGDNQASFMGAVNHNEKSLLVNIGTSGQISFFTPQAVQNPQIDARPFTQGGFLLVGSSLCGGRSYALLEEFFKSVVQMATGTAPGALFEIMNQAAEDYPKLDNKLEISTRFSGTREHPRERAAIHNLGADNFTPRHFIVGVLEGAARELFDLYKVMRPELAQKPEMLIGSGNAMRLCRPLQRIVSEMFDMPIHIPRYKEEAGYGAALFALTAAGYFKSLDEAQSLVQYE